MSAIDVTDLTRTYRSRKSLLRGGVVKIEALRGVSFEVEPGELFGLLGPNGAGKTTMILSKEIAVGCAYLIAGLALLRLFERQGRSSGSLDRF